MPTVISTYYPAFNGTPGVDDLVFNVASGSVQLLGGDDTSSSTGS